MAVTMLTGDLATDIINQTQRKLDVDDAISDLEPNVAPFVRLIRKLKKVPAISPNVQWLENERMPHYDIMSASATSAATSLPTANSAYWRVGDVVRVTDTGEAVEVTGVSASALGVNRAIGGVAAASAASGAEMFLVANVNAEGASLRQIKSVRLVNANNYCEIVRTPFGITGTEAASGLYGGPDRDRLQAYFGIEHERSLEHIAFFGAKKEDTTTSGAPKRFAGGLIEYISTNVTNAGGTLSEASFQTFLRSGFRYGSERKVLFGAPKVVAAIEGYARANLKVENEMGKHGDTYGIQMTSYVSGQGIVDIVMHRDWNDSLNYTGFAFLVDIDAVSYRPLRDTKLLMDRQANDADKVEDEYLTEATFEIQHERRHALLKGVTG